MEISCYSPSISHLFMESESLLIGLKRFSQLVGMPVNKTELPQGDRCSFSVVLFFEKLQCLFNQINAFLPLLSRIADIRQGQIGISNLYRIPQSSGKLDDPGGHLFTFFNLAKFIQDLFLHLT